MFLTGIDYFIAKLLMALVHSVGYIPDAVTLGSATQNFGALRVRYLSIKSS